VRSDAWMPSTSTEGHRHRSSRSCPDWSCRCPADGGCRTRWSLHPGRGRRLNPASPLPFCRIATHVGDREDDDDFGFHREVRGIRKPPHQDTADSRLEILIPEGIIRDAVVRDSQLIEELKTKPGSLATTGTLPRRPGRLAARQPADTRSPIRIRQAPEYFVRGPRTTGVSAIRGKPLLGETKVRFWYRELSRPLRDAIPKSLQIADLLRLRERCEPRRRLETGARRSSPAFARS
jgi:hypothetical protein